ncbi:hypothetical protein J6590_010852 [Homalodisca vitripennis]|nr:hypothetical protein J6590_010852 [Homalodisca vitripennis]
MNRYRQMDGKRNEMIIHSQFFTLRYTSNAVRSHAFYNSAMRYVDLWTFSLLVWLDFVAKPCAFLLQMMELVMKPQTRAGAVPKASTWHLRALDLSQLVPFKAMHLDNGGQGHPPPPRARNTRGQSHDPVGQSQLAALGREIIGENEVDAHTDEVDAEIHAKEGSQGASIGRQEVIGTMKGVRFLNQHIIEIVLGSTLDATKYVRRAARYRPIVEAAALDLGAAVGVVDATNDAADILCCPLAFGVLPLLSNFHLRHLIRVPCMYFVKTFILLSLFWLIH